VIDFFTAGVAEGLAESEGVVRFALSVFWAGAGVAKFSAAGALDGSSVA